MTEACQRLITIIRRAWNRRIDQDGDVRRKVPQIGGQKGNVEHIYACLRTSFAERGIAHVGSKLRLTPQEFFDK